MHSQWQEWGGLTAGTQHEQAPSTQHPSSSIAIINMNAHHPQSQWKWVMGWWLPLLLITLMTQWQWWGLNTNLKWQWVLRACILSSNAEGSPGYALVSFYERWERMSMVWYKSKYQSLILIAGDRIEDWYKSRSKEQWLVTCWGCGCWHHGVLVVLVMW